MSPFFSPPSSSEEESEESESSSLSASSMPEKSSASGAFAGKWENQVIYIQWRSVRSAKISC